MLGRPHGIRGDIYFRPHNPQSRAFDEVRQLWLVQRRASVAVYEVTSMRPVADAYIAHLDGVDDREAAAALSLGEVLVARTWLPPLEPGEYFVEDVVGCTVEGEDGRPLGVVQRHVVERRARRRDGRHRRRSRAHDSPGARVRAERRRRPPARCGCVGEDDGDGDDDRRRRRLTPRAAAITFELVTLFPEMFDGLLATTVIGKAITAGIVAVHRTNPRDFGLGNYRQVDDTPYGGGPGMIMRVEPIATALDAIAAARGPSHRILLTPRGRRFDQDGGPRAGGAPAHHAGVRSLRGRRRARRFPDGRPDLPRRLRPGRRRAGGGGRARGDRATGSGRPRLRPVGGRRVVLRRGGSNIRNGRVPPNGRARCRRPCCYRATMRLSRAGAGAPRCG